MPIGKKRLQVHLDERTNPQTVLQHSLGILLVFYTGKAPGRLFVAFMITIKPFDNEVANHTAHDSNEKRDYNFHSDTSSLLRVLVSNTKIITYYLTFFYLFHQKEFRLGLWLAESDARYSYGHCLRAIFSWSQYSFLLSEITLISFFVLRYLLLT